MDIYRSMPDVLNFCIDTEYVADFYRAYKMHAIEGHRNGTALGALTRANARGDVHLRQHPATEDITSWILIGGHCKGACGEFTSGFVWHA